VVGSPVFYIHDWMLNVARSIVDDDAVKVSTWFYGELVAHEIIDGSTIAYALDAAVDKLRKSGVSPNRWVPFIYKGV
jgi:hypothetical protein